MTKLIPLDAAIAVLANDRIRMNVSGTEFRVISTQDHIDAIRAIPAIDPDAIRDAALALSQECPWRDDTYSYREWHEDRRAIATRLLALIGKANSMIGEKK